MSLLARIFGRRAQPAPGAEPAREGDPGRVREVEAVLRELRPSFAADGGDVRLVFVRGGVVGLSLHGACAGCAASALTIEMSIRPKLRARCAWFERLERV